MNRALSKSRTVFTRQGGSGFDATANAYARIRLGNANNAKVLINDEQLQYAQTITTQNIIITLQPGE